MIPVATTTIAVLRVPEDDHEVRDPEDVQPDPVEIATGIPAHISTSRGREEREGASTQEIVDFRLSCNVTDLTADDRVRDEATGEVYEVTWARERRGLGLDHTEAGLRQVTGNLPVAGRAVRS